MKNESLIQRRRIRTSRAKRLFLSLAMPLILLTHFAAFADSIEDSSVLFQFRYRENGQVRRATGSGTVILSNERETLILTAYHVLFHSDGSRMIGGSLFRNAGELVGDENFDIIDWNEGFDLALVRLRHVYGFRSAKIAPPSQPVIEGANLTTIGFDRYRESHRKSMKVVEPYVYEDRISNGQNTFFPGSYVMRADTQIPPGNSGGGAFLNGRLVGVIRAAGPSKSLFVPLSLIHIFLEKNRLAYLYGEGPGGAVVEAPISIPHPQPLPPRKAVALVDFGAEVVMVSGGIRVLRVTPYSLAEASSIRAGDIIIRVNDRPVDGVHMNAEILRRLDDRGDSLRLRLAAHRY